MKYGLENQKPLPITHPKHFRLTNIIPQHPNPISRHTAVIYRYTATI